LSVSDQSYACAFDDDDDCGNIAAGEPQVVPDHKHAIIGCICVGGGATRTTDR